ncbi:MAG: hypothetical protein CMJ95_10525 [Planctomycetes bacterium]|nr:hypothetical protein [Planctomycetota bacterium]
MFTTKLRFIIFLLASGFGFSGCLGIPGRSIPLTKANKELYQQSFQVVCERIENTYWDSEALGTQWSQWKAFWGNEMNEARTVKEARGAIQKLLAELELSHFALIPQDAAEGLGQGGGAETGAILRVSDGRAVVVRVETDSPAQSAGVVPGEFVVSVGKKPLEPLIKEWSASGNRYLPVQGLAASMQGAVSSTRSYEIENAQGDLRDVEITLETPKGTGRPVRFGHIGPIPLRLEKKIMDGGFLYLRFNMFLGPMQVMPWFQKALEDHAEAPGLILDLRGNPGGLGLMACGIAGWLVEEDGLELGVMHSRDSDLKFAVNPRLDPWKNPVAVLVDEGSASTTEILAQGLQDLEVARIFGRTTAGAALPSMIESLPCGDLFQYAIAGYRSRSGKRLEGAGVVPDEVIPVDVQKIRDEGDPVLKAALRWFDGSAGTGRKAS